MRPDEHKKKNSARYKKKHGQQSSSNNASANATRSKDKPSTPEVIEKAQVKPVKNILEETQVKQQQHKDYSRRIVESNWEKYEETEETVQRIGEDFNQLLQSAGGVSSHMKLESEKDWEAEQALDDLLTVDVQRIADVLGQLSFCERFGFDERQFDSSLLSQLNGEKCFVEDKTSSTFGTYAMHNYDFDFKVPKTSTITNPLKPSQNLDESYKSDGDAASPDLVKVSASDESNQLEKDLKTSPQSQHYDATSLAETNRPIIENMEGNVLSAELDSPFQANTSQLKNSKDKDENLSSKNQNHVEDLESELDALLSDNSATQSTGAKVKSQAPDFPKPSTNSSLASVMASNTDDLEDWLDSII